MKNVVTEVVQNDLCIGCGVCASVCPAKNLEIYFDDQGKYVPCQDFRCLDNCNLCLKICPFGPAEYFKNENIVVGDIFRDKSFKHNEIIGHYHELFAGYANNSKDRQEGTSGGIGRFLLKKLFKENLIDYAVHVVQNDDPEKLFKYAVASTVDDINDTAKSTYYPVEMSEIINFIAENDGRYAITALPCFVKGLRSLQGFNYKFRDRIKFILGLTCGQMKTKHFTKYVSVIGGLDVNDQINRITYRCKKQDQPANNYYYNISGRKNIQVNWQEEINQIWNNRWFTPNACNFCDDVFAELADLSLMDAWLPEYTQDWRGNNMIVSRNPIITSILKECNKKEEISISAVEENKILKSQKPVIHTKRQELAWRLYDLEKKGKRTISKLVNPSRTVSCNPDYIIMRLKENIRRKSFKHYPEILVYSRKRADIKFDENFIFKINLIMKLFVKLNGYRRKTIDCSKRILDFRKSDS